MSLSVLAFGEFVAPAVRPGFLPLLKAPVPTIGPKLRAKVVPNTITCPRIVYAFDIAAALESSLLHVRGDRSHPLRGCV